MQAIDVETSCCKQGCGIDLETDDYSGRLHALPIPVRNAENSRHHRRISEGFWGWCARAAAGVVALLSLGLGTWPSLGTALAQPPDIVFERANEGSATAPTDASWPEGPRAPSSGERAIYLCLGAGGGQPISGQVRKVYSHGWMVSGALGWRTHPAWRVELRVDRLTKDGRPDVPAFGIPAESRLELLPISLGFTHLLRTAGSIRPFVTGGPSLVRLQESFDYPLLNGDSRLTARRNEFGGFAGFGVEARRTPLTYRLAARAFFASGAYEVTRPRGDEIERIESRHPSLWTATLEVMFP